MPPNDRRQEPRDARVEIVETRVYTLTFDAEAGLSLDEIQARYASGDLAESRWQFERTSVVKFRTEDEDEGNPSREAT